VNVCVIGNSANVLDEELGDKIDLCDIVIRIQLFKIDGFEKYIGTKTSIFSSSWRSSAKVRNCFKSGNIDIETTEIWSAFPLLGIRHSTCVDVLGHSKIIQPTSDFYNRVVSNIYSNYWTKKPSSGIMTLEMARSHFSKDKIYICGFDSKIEKDHYYDPNAIDRLGPGETLPGHNWEGEWNHIQCLLERKEIFHIRDFQ
tara:strand:- start:395 stop:991 length:597 start_codon:yes stop_codon:yes gene_type:complete